MIQWMSIRLQRDLRHPENEANFYIIGIRISQSNVNIGAVPTASAPSQKVFGLNPHVEEIVPSSSDGAKNWMKATKELLEKDKVKVTIANCLSRKV